MYFYTGYDGWAKYFDPGAVILTPEANIAFNKPTWQSLLPEP